MAQVSERFDELGADGASVRLGLMGGTFDPIHIGHLRIAEEVREALALDAVLFIPAGNPVFKRDQRVTDAAVRLAQVARAVADNPHFDVSAIEVERGGDTYTVDTLRELRHHFPENVEFYFIVGSDAAATIGKWRGRDELAGLAHLAVAVGRPGFAQADELRATIAKAGPFEAHLVQVSSLEVSSRDIRDRLKAGKSVRYLVPPLLEAEMPCPAPGALASNPDFAPELASAFPAGECVSNLDFAVDFPAGKCVPDSAFPAGERRRELTPSRSRGEGDSSSRSRGENDSRSRGENDSRSRGENGSARENGSAPPLAPLSKSFLNARKAELQRRVSPKRFEHSLAVCETCVKLAKRYGVDAKKARLAGLLHDWDKGLNDEEARARVRELHMEDELDPWVVEHMPRVLHGYTAARALAREFPEIPADVLQAIDRHTTAAEDMSPLDMVLYIADAIEPGRRFGRIDELRAAVGEVDLEELYFQTYEYWTFLLFERRKTLHPDTMRIWNANVLRREGRRQK